MTKMILSGGGTAGHIYPALALACELRTRGIDLSYIGTPAGPEARLVPEAGIDFVPLDAAGFDRAHKLTFATSALRSLRSSWRARKFLRETKAAAVVAFGGYVTVPVGLAARLTGVPLFLHEQNSVLGMTNRFLARNAAFVGVTYPATVAAVQTLTKAPVAFVGNPVRPSVLTGDAVAGRAVFDLPENAVILTVFGGSRGARHINEAMLRLSAALLTEITQLHVIHATGPAEYDAFTESLDETLRERPYLRARYHALPYLEAMGDILAATDVALTRAGATTIAEITARGIPSLLIPYPYATDDHQTGNAAALVAQGGARMVADKDLDTLVFEEALRELLTNQVLRTTMAAKAKELGKPNAAKELAEALLGQLG